MHGHREQGRRLYQEVLALSATGELDGRCMGLNRMRFVGRMA